MKNYKLKIKKGAIALLFTFCIFNFAFAQTILTADGLAAYCGTNAPTGGGGGGGGFPSGALIDLKLNGDLLDASGNGNSASLSTGTAAYTTDETGAATHAFSFNGSTVIALTDATVGDFASGDFTISIWVKVTSANFSANPVVISKGVFNLEGYYLQFTKNSGDATKAEFDVRFNQSGASQLVKTANTQFTVNTWYNIVFVRSGSTGKIYKNGSDVTDAGSQSLVNPGADNTHALQVGDYTGTGFKLTGNVAEVSVWSSALTGTQASDINLGGSR